MSAMRTTARTIESLTVSVARATLSAMLDDAFAIDQTRTRTVRSIEAVLTGEDITLTTHYEEKR